ncbi:hypothetical protein ACI7YT_12535 [Microbacterium sp. M]|uniref:hypothetical protein n=1 Tax=Microbacterium sp. M TaxID=3377125 RepID=UPI003862D4B8
MTYQDTARAFVRAEQSTRAGFTPTPEALAADRLPLSEWAEPRRADMTPQTIAKNHVRHVSDTAHELREALGKWENADGSELDDPARPLADAARALLTAIGENA